MPTPASLGTSAKNWYETIITPDSGGKSLEVLASSAGEWIAVRDVAEAHVLAFEKNETHSPPSWLIILCPKNSSLSRTCASLADSGLGSEWNDETWRWVCLYTVPAVTEVRPLISESLSMTEKAVNESSTGAAGFHPILDGLRCGRITGQCTV